MEITEKYLNTLIKNIEFNVLKHKTVCKATLNNGYEVTAKLPYPSTRAFEQRILRSKVLSRLKRLEEYRIKAEAEPLEQTWQGRLLLEYRQLQTRTEKLYQFLSTNPNHEAAEILSAQYRPMCKYLAVLQKRVAALDETTRPVPPDLEPVNKIDE